MDKWDDALKPPKMAGSGVALSSLPKMIFLLYFPPSSILSVQCDELPLEIFGLICNVPENQKLLEACRIKSEQSRSASEKSPILFLFHMWNSDSLTKVKDQTGGGEPALLK